MSEVIQMFLSVGGASALPPSVKVGDAGTEGFAEAFEQQMQAVAPPKSAALPPGSDPARKADERDEARPPSEAEPKEADPVFGASVDALRLPVRSDLPAQPEPIHPLTPEIAASPALPGPDEAIGPPGTVPAVVVNDAEVALSKPGALPSPAAPSAPSGLPSTAPADAAKVRVPETALPAAPKAVASAVPATAASPAPAAPAPAGSNPFDQEAGGPPSEGRSGASSRPAVPAVTAAVAAVQDGAASPTVQVDPVPAAPSQLGLVPVSNPAVLLPVSQASGAMALQAPSSVEGLSSSSPSGPASTTAGATGEGKGASGPRSSQTAMIDRIVATARMMSTARGEKVFLLRLAPPQLGHIRVSLTVQDGVLNATVQTESHAARQSILQNLDQLKGALSEQGLQLGRFDVFVEGEAGSQLGAGQGGGRRRSGEEALSEEILAGPGAGLRRAEDEDEGGAEGVLSDAMAVDLFI